MEKKLAPINHLMNAVFFEGGGDRSSLRDSRNYVFLEQFVFEDCDKKRTAKWLKRSIPSPV